MMSNNINGYNITTFEIIPINGLANFEIKVMFKHNSDGIDGILINYHFICVMLVLVASINFLIDPKVVPGRAGLLVTLFLVLITFFSDAQVKNLKG